MGLYVFRLFCVLTLLSIIARCWVFLVVTGRLIAPQNETVYLLFHDSIYRQFDNSSFRKSWLNFA